MTTLSDPANGVFAITPSDSVALAHVTRAIRVVGAGNLSILGADGAAATCVFAAGETRPIRAMWVYATTNATTTCTGIEGMY